MSGIRISTGTLRGRKIPVPGEGVRPTSARARQAWFDIVGHQVEESRFLDLFAGSGAFSFEAVSRGATEAWAIDHSRHSTKMIQKLAESWKVPVHVVAADALAGLRRLPTQHRFDVVYADPPYDYARYSDLVRAIDQAEWIAAGAIVGVEFRSGRSAFDPSVVERLKYRRTASWGEVSVAIFDLPDDEI